MNKVFEHDKELTSYALEKLKEVGVKVIGPSNVEDRGAVISFVMEGLHPHDISEILNRYGVAVRGGHHCAMPLHKKLGLVGSTRASFYLYNTKEDVDVFVRALKKTKEIFK